MTTAGVASSEARERPWWSPASPPRQVLRTSREIVIDTGRALLRVGPLLLAIALVTFVAQYLLTGWAAMVALDHGPAGLGLLFLSITLRLVLLAVSLFLAAGAVRIDGESLVDVGMRQGRERGGSGLESFGHRLKLAMVPMVVLYAAWNLVNWDIHLFMADKYLFGLDRIDVDATGPQQTDFSNISFSGGAWKAYIPWAIGCWLVKLAVDRVAERYDSRPLDLVVIFLEVSWVVFGWLVVSSVLAQAVAFFRTREISLWLRDAGDAVSVVLRPLHVTFPELLSSVVSVVSSALHVVLVQIIRPLFWVAVVGLLVGWASGDRDLTARLRGGDRSVRALGGVLNSSTRGLREKYYPVMTTTWTMLRSGPLPALTITVLYAVLMLGLGWLRWAGAELAGPGGPSSTRPNETLFSLLDALTVPVRACFLAAAFAVVLRLETVHRAGRRGVSAG